MKFSTIFSIFKVFFMTLQTKYISFQPKKLYNEFRQILANFNNFAILLQYFEFLNILHDISSILIGVCIQKERTKNSTSKNLR